MEAMFNLLLLLFTLLCILINIDHVHLVIEAHPSLDLSQLIANLKTVSSRLIRKEFSQHLSKYFWKPYFWSKSYGVKSVSRGANLDKIIEYVRNQEKPAN